MAGEAGIPVPVPGPFQGADQGPCPSGADVAQRGVLGRIGPQEEDHCLSSSDVKAANRDHQAVEGHVRSWDYAVAACLGRSEGHMIQEGGGPCEGA